MSFWLVAGLLGLFYVASQKPPQGPSPPQQHYQPPQAQVALSTEPPIIDPTKYGKYKIFFFKVKYDFSEPLNITFTVPEITLKGLDITLECKVNQQPDYFKFYRVNEDNIQEIEQSDKYIVENGKLIINDLDLNDNGDYKCEAGTVNVTEAVTVTLQVKQLALGNNCCFLQ